MKNENGAKIDITTRGVCYAKIVNAAESAYAHRANIEASNGEANRPVTKIFCASAAGLIGEWSKAEAKAIGRLIHRVARIGRKPAHEKMKNVSGNILVVTRRMTALGVSKMSRRKSARYSRLVAKPWSR